MRDFDAITREWLSETMILLLGSEYDTIAGE